MAEKQCNLIKNGGGTNPYISSFEQMTFSVPIDGTIKQFEAPEDAYYCLVATNNGAGDIFTYILKDSNSSVYYAACTAPNASFTRCSTGFVPLKAGTKVYLRAKCTLTAYVVKGK